MFCLDIYTNLSIIYMVAKVQFFIELTHNFPKNIE